MGKFRPVEPPKLQKEVKELNPVEFETVDAVIDNCECLNIRKDPEVKSNNQIAILGKGTKIVVVDPKKTEKNKDGEWYRIRIYDKDTKGLTDGYGMKKYIEII